MIWRFVVRRVLIAILQLVGISLVVFFLIRLLPADPVARLVGFNATQVAYDQAEAALGLNKSVIQQLGDYLGIMSTAKYDGIAQGYLGDSWVTGSPISEEIGRFLPVTLELITSSLLIAFLIAVPVGITSAMRPDGVGAKITFFWGLFAGSQPEFWWGLMFVFFFFTWWWEQFGFFLAPAPLGRINPMLIEPAVITGFILVDSILSLNFEAFVDAAWHLMLPVFTLVFIVSGPIIKMIRQNMVRVLRSDFILYARSCGLPSRSVSLYALRAAMAPAMTLIGIFYGFLLGGAVPIEVIFALGGLGEYSIRSILSFDYPAIQGTVLIIAMVSLLVYLTIDILHAFLDPRITF